MISAVTIKLKEVNITRKLYYAKESASLKYIDISEIKKFEYSA